MQRNMRLLPIEQVAVLQSEREAMRLCFDAYNRGHDVLEDWQWAALLGITKGQFSEYMTEKPNRPKHVPEKIRRQVQRLTGFAAITQYHAYQDGYKLTQIDDNDQLRLKDAEVLRLRAELEQAKSLSGGAKR